MFKCFRIIAFSFLAMFFMWGACQQGSSPKPSGPSGALTSPAPSFFPSTSGATDCTAYQAQNCGLSSSNPSGSSNSNVDLVSEEKFSLTSLSPSPSPSGSTSPSPSTSGTSGTSYTMCTCSGVVNNLEEIRNALLNPEKKKECNGQGKLYEPAGNVRDCIANSSYVASCGDSQIENVFDTLGNRSGASAVRRVNELKGQGFEQDQCGFECSGACNLGSDGLPSNGKPIVIMVKAITDSSAPKIEIQYVRPPK